MNVVSNKIPIHKYLCEECFLFMFSFDFNSYVAIKNSFYMKFTV